MPRQQNQEGVNVYEYLKGTLASLDHEYAVIDIHGIGYRIDVPINLVGTLKIGSVVQLYTSWVVREQSQTLYGFASKEERDLFELLIGISGIGPRTALNLLGRLSPDKLASAIHKHDVAALSSVPGIGKKTAERLLIDLKGKHFATRAVATTAIGEALQAMMNLGYTQLAAEKALEKAAATVDPNDLSALLAAALRA